MRQWIAFRLIFLCSVFSGTKKFLAFHWSTSNSSVSSVLSVVLRLSNQKKTSYHRGHRVHRDKTERELKQVFPRCPRCPLWFYPFQIKNILPQSSQRTTEIKKQTRTQTHTSFLGILGALCGCMPFKSKTFYHRAHREPQRKKTGSSYTPPSVSSVLSVVIRLSNQKKTSYHRGHRVHRDKTERESKQVFPR
jgi:hypothetical protein